MRKKVETEMDAARADIEQQILPQGKDVVRHLEIPKQGCTLEWILDAMEQMDREAPSRTDYRDGKLSGAVYRAYCRIYPIFVFNSSADGGDDMEKVLVTAFQRYCVSNPLHPDVFPAVRKMEAEIVAMCLRMYNNPTGAGATTSGGTESILMSVKTHRDWARTVKGISEPEMRVVICFMTIYSVLTRLVHHHRVVSASAHAAFDKAASYFNIKLHSIPVDPETRQADLRRVRRAMSVSFVLTCSRLTSSSETRIRSWSYAYWFSIAGCAHHDVSRSLALLSTSQTVVRMISSVLEDWPRNTTLASTWTAVLGASLCLS